jgi:hypothetical protein
VVKDTDKGEAAAAGSVNTDEDRYLTLTQALARINSEIASGGVTVDRVEITCLANGEANCRWWTPRSEEAEFVHIPDPTIR